MPAQIDRSVHKIKGVGAVPGGAVGPAFVYVRQQLQVPQRSIPMEEVPAELQRYDHAMTTADQELRSLFEEAKKQDFGKDGNTLRFQFEMLKELSPAVRKLVGQGANAEAAVDQVFGDWIRKFQAMATDDFRLKANDIADVRSRMLRKLLGISEPTSPSFTDGPVVLVASVLEPSEAFTLSSSKILAVCTDGGGARDHTAVICRHRGIPVVAGLADLSKNLAQGQELAVDAFNGVVTINPDESVKAALLATMRLNEVRFKSKPLTKGGSATRDGTRIAIVANVESLHDVTRISKTALQGVGLFRSEFLFLSRDTPPSEDEQYAVFLAAAQALGKRPLTIRTMDFGDDKWPQWDTTRQRLGPDVTYSPKGIRLSLSHQKRMKQFFVRTAERYCVLPLRQTCA